MVRRTTLDVGADIPRARTGIKGLDDILGGGLPTNHLYLIDGEPGTGKTTLALQFLIEGANNGERGLYLTLSESKAELEAVAESHCWSLEIKLWQVLVACPDSCAAVVVGADGKPVTPRTRGTLDRI